MGLLLGALSALAVGIADVLGRRVAQTNHAVSLSGMLQLFATATALGAALVFPSTLDGRDVAIGAISGLGMGAGLAAYFTGMTASTATVVAPTVGALVAIIPFSYTVLTGTRPSALAIGGGVLALVGLVVLSAGSGARRTTPTQIRAGLAWGTLSGVCYSTGFTIVIETSEASGAWPSVSQRLTAALFTFALAARLRLPLFPSIDRGGLGFASASGVFGGLSSITYLLGVQLDARPTVVMASTFPAVSVLGGALVLSDEVTRRQAAGLVATLVGVAVLVST